MYHFLSGNWIPSLVLFCFGALLSYIEYQQVSISVLSEDLNKAKKGLGYSAIWTEILHRELEKAKGEEYVAALLHASALTLRIIKK